MVNYLEKGLKQEYNYWIQGRVVIRKDPLLEGIDSKEEFDKLRDFVINKCITESEFTFILHNLFVTYIDDYKNMKLIKYLAEKDDVNKFDDSYELEDLLDEEEVI